MRKLYIIIFALLIGSFSVQSKNWFIEGTEWTVKYSSCDPFYESSTDYIYKLIETTNSLKDRGYLTLTEYREGYDDEPQKIGYIRSEDNLVFYREYYDPEKEVRIHDELIYNFNLTQDLICRIYNPECHEETLWLCLGRMAKNPKYDDLNTIELSGLRWSREGLIEPSSFDTKVIWIEGIGDDRGVIQQRDVDRIGGTSSLVKVTNNGEVIYSYKGLNEVRAIESQPDFKVSVDGLTLNVESTNANAHISVYNTEGLTVAQKEIIGNTTMVTLPSQGIYYVKVGDHTEKILAK